MIAVGGITKELATGKFTEEMMGYFRSMIGTELRTDGCVNNEFATRLAITRFCEGIGKDGDADGDHLAKVKTCAMNQRGQNVMPGTATIALPTCTASEE